MKTLKPKGDALFFCMGSHCKGKNEKLFDWAKEKKSFKPFHILQMKCSGHCDDKPVVFDSNSQQWLGKMKKEDLKAMVETPEEKAPSEKKKDKSKDKSIEKKSKGKDKA